MQFGIFTVGDVTPDPTTGRAPTERPPALVLVLAVVAALFFALPFLGLLWVPGELHEPGADTEAVLSEWLGVPA